MLRKNIRSSLTGLNDINNCSIQAGDNLADAFSMRMTYQTADYTETPQYNGNIASLSWRAPLGTCRDIQGYHFSYDGVNRLRGATFWERSSGAPTITDKYSEPLVNYNLNGNITTYQRRGQTTSNTFDLIDNLVYFYDANIPDRLIRVVDLAPTANRPYGFAPKGTTYYYGYDNAGNMTSDGHKDLTVAYNALNLPDVFTFANVTPNNKIEIVYNAAGEKLEKQVYTGATLSTHKRYVMGIEYTGTTLEAIYHAEGRIVPIGGGVFRYEYTLKDHLGNSRVNFAANGTAIQLLQENHYYPFGMEMKGAWIAQSGTENGYQYNGKELNEDWGLNWMDYGARWYDASVGRWNAVDPLAEKFMSWSAYNYVYNNPIANIDPDGRSGIGTIDKEKKTVTISSHFYVYGNGANAETAKMLADQIQTLWNNAGGTRTIDGVKYAVKYNITYDVVSVEAAADKAASNDTKPNFETNFARIEEGYSGSAKNERISGTYARGSNSMILSVADLENGTTAAHEYGHGLGLLHPGSPNNELGFEVKGQPGIMATELSIVELPYTKNPEAGKNPQVIRDPITGRGHVDNPLDRTKRAVTSMDVSNIYLHSITNQRQPEFGGISNIIYSSNGEIVRRKP